MSKLLEELKEKRAEAASELEKMREIEKGYRNAAEEYEKQIADLDKAISALLDPVPSPSHESSSQETVTEAAQNHVDKLNELMGMTNEMLGVEPVVQIPEGFTRWEGGERPFDGAVQVVYRGLATPIGDTIDSRGLRWTHLDRASDIIAYRVIEAPAETAPVVSELDSQVTPQDATEQSQENPAAQMFGKALVAESEAKVQEPHGGYWDGNRPFTPEPGPAAVLAHGLVREADEREQAVSLISKLFGAPKPKLEDA